MKTITEYRPLIFSEMAAQAQDRLERRRISRTDLAFAGVYGLASLILMLQIGCTPLEWPFWTVFAPLFIASELAVFELRRR